MGHRGIFDVILASDAVHHLLARAKQEFFRLAHAAFADGGPLLFADMVSAAGFDLQRHELSRDAAGFHRLLVFTKAAGG